MFAINIKFKKPAIYPKKEIVDKLEVGNLIWLVPDLHLSHCIITFKFRSMNNTFEKRILDITGYWKIKLSKKKFLSSILRNLRSQTFSRSIFFQINALHSIALSSTFSMTVCTSKALDAPKALACVLYTRMRVPPYSTLSVSLCRYERFDADSGVNSTR